MDGPNRLALFDCDGTLVDSQGSICAAMEAAFRSLGLPPPGRAATLRIVGLSLVEAMAALLPQADAALHLSLAERYKAAFQDLRRGGQAGEPLFDGIPDALATLAADGWLLGVATGKSDRGLALCLEHHGLGGHFVTLQTADRHPSKPHPSMILAAMAEAGAVPATTAMIGDTCYDMGLAHAGGAAAIGVAWGYHHADELLAEGASAVARHPSDLPALLEALP